MEINVIEKNGAQAVDAKELHRLLEVGKDFSTWIKDRIKKYDFKEGEDFFCVKMDQADQTDQSENFDANLGGRKNANSPQNGGLSNKKTGRGGKRPGAGNPNFVPIDYLLSMDMAKELSIIENNDIGRKIRRHLIEVEKAWNDPEKIRQRAAQMDGFIHKTVVDELLKEIKALGISSVRFPFPGCDAVPIKVKKYSTKKGGRVYVLTYRGKTLARHILGYDANGKHVATGTCSERLDGTPISTHFSDFVDRNKHKIGDTYNLEMVNYDDYFNWKASLIEAKYLHNALPAPEEITPELEEPKGERMGIDDIREPKRKEKPRYIDDDAGQDFRGILGDTVDEDESKWTDDENEDDVTRKIA